MRILDIGANDGTTAKMFCENNKNFVVAVEPNALIKPSLEGLNIEWEVKAVSNVDNEKIDMYVANNHVLNSLNEHWLKEGRFSNCWVGSTVSVETVTIDSLFAKYHNFDFIKMDVEGYEDIAVLGMSKKYCPIQFEWTIEWIHITENVLDHLESLGYSKFNIGGDFSHYSELQPTSYLCRDDLIEGLKERSRSEYLAFGNILAR
jgi:FkbM family methyltransferase